MSGIYLLALIAIWLFAGRIIYRIWRRWKPAELTRKIPHVAIGILLFSIWFGGAFWEVAGKKIYWDAKVRKLCDKDGGVKVHEKVSLPEEKYNQYALRNWILPNESHAKPSDEYYVETEKYYYRQNAPQVARTQHRLVRRTDGKVLGELIRYSRGGGDLPGPWHGSSFMCPDLTTTKFESSIFNKGDNR